MRIKSYFAESVQIAIERARLELGPEAMLMNSKRTEKDLKHLGEFEVIFGVPHRLAVKLNRSAESSKTSPVEAPEPPSSLAHELADLRRQIENMRDSVASQGRLSGRGSMRHLIPLIEDAYSELTSQEMSDEMTAEIVDAVERRISSSEPGGQQSVSAQRVEEALAEELADRLSVFSESRALKERAIMLVGPAGVGKTTTLAKLALRYGIQSRTPVQVLSADTLRVGGWEPLGTYARIAGLPFQAIESVAMLHKAIHEHSGNRLLLIDTPGFSGADMADAEELTNFASRESRVEVHLVLPANIGFKTALRVRERFAGFKPAHLVLTHLDDGCSPGAVLELTIRLGLSVSYLCSGQQIPDDLAIASKEAMIDGLCPRGEAIAAVSAA
ncbi:MAG: hypothetical protein JO033_17320 [Acidobacteriaceae bacterium]|nr:hypothetical protein [Acidobacteriaceae bacterium]MBV9500149.1 hypothetical protein [Acidobacteriaceae bacterium]